MTVRRRGCRAAAIVACRSRRWRSRWSRGAARRGRRCRPARTAILEGVDDPERERDDQDRPLREGSGAAAAAATRATPIAARFAATSRVRRSTRSARRPAGMPKTSPAPARSANSRPIAPGSARTSQTSATMLTLAPDGGSRSTPREPDSRVVGTARAPTPSQGRVSDSCCDTAGRRAVRTRRRTRRSTSTVTRMGFWVGNSSPICGFGFPRRAAATMRAS